MQILFLESGINIYQYVATIISFFIVIFFSISVYFGILYQICKTYTPHYNWLNIYITLISFMWVVIFSYILIADLINNPVLVSTEFGGTYIRPLILLTSAGTAILQRLNYLKNKKYGGKKICQK